MTQFIAQFGPPNASGRARDFWQRLRPKLNGVPADAIRIDTIRAVGGEVVRICLVDDRFAADLAGARQSGAISEAMGDEPYARYDVIECVVSGYAHYGILVWTPAGEPGWIEAHYVEDSVFDDSDPPRVLNLVSVQRPNWPAVGSTIVAGVLGPRTQDGRWRLAARPSFLAMCRADRDGL